MKVPHVSLPTPITLASTITSRVRAMQCSAAMMAKTFDACWEARDENYAFLCAKRSVVFGHHFVMPSPLFLFEIPAKHLSWVLKRLHGIWRALRRWCTACWMSDTGLKELT